MRSHFTRGTFAVLMAMPVVLANCIATHAESRIAHCTRVETADSARAACVALDTLFRIAKRTQVAIEVRKDPVGFVVRTIPGDGVTLDGMARVTVNDELRVVGIVWGDSL